MAEALDIFGAPRRALAAAKKLFASVFTREEAVADFFPLNDLPNDVLVSVFAATEDPTWVRHAFPLVCKAWNELYRSRDASPLHETLEVDFEREVRGAEAAVTARERWRRRVLAAVTRRPPAVHASRVISWAEERAGWVRGLHLYRGYRGNIEDFNAEDLGALVAVVGPSLTDISISHGDLCTRPFWESLRTSVVPAGRLRSLFVADIRSGVDQSDVEPLGQLAGSLEELELQTPHSWDFPRDPSVTGLSRFSESLCALEKLRRLALVGHPQITAIPAGISSLKKLEELVLECCELSSLPKELGELSGLTRLDLSYNRRLGATPPAGEAFPAELGKMKSLRELDLRDCGLSTVPAFIGELESLEVLLLESNDFSTPEDEAFPEELGKMKSLRELYLERCFLRTVPACVCKLKSLTGLHLRSNDLSSLPKELGELSRLTTLDLGENEDLGRTLPAAEAFPAQLGKMKSLRRLCLDCCGLRTVPSFVGKLKSLESLCFRYNEYLQIDAPLDSLIEGCSHLCEVSLSKPHRAEPWTPESLAHLEAFVKKWLARNPDAEVEY